ncbi:uncharacterized protein BXZ73DRAFT_77044 [Epithele typhae]|uniref:uncharacterized protein n=1 Tax=Epithele typhae TaxID=378194 RepID=UPI002007F52B|nr:uncharacterized protein BXZ73DRAFT_77044 [Epithele typhae]KAH9934573.1 hypothetical protein BXZ73DRAFT_77044 [Epithele typhae]
MKSSASTLSLAPPLSSLRSRAQVGQGRKLKLLESKTALPLAQQTGLCPPQAQPGRLALAERTPGSSATSFRPSPRQPVPPNILGHVPIPDPSDLGDDETVPDGPPGSQTADKLPKNAPAQSGYTARRGYNALPAALVRTTPPGSVYPYSGSSDGSYRCSQDMNFADFSARPGCPPPSASPGSSSACSGAGETNARGSARSTQVKNATRAATAIPAVVPAERVFLVAFEAEREVVGDDPVVEEKGISVKVMGAVEEI